MPIILIILSNDVHTNPGPQFQNNFFNFKTWNVNSLAKENFQCVHLIEAHNSIFNYDLISICETSLNDSVELPETLLDDYTFVPANNPANTRHGGVGLFYRNTLPIMIRDDLSFDETIVVELKFGRKKYSSLSCTEVPPLTMLPLNFEHFCQILRICIPKLRLKTLLQRFLQVTLMLTPIFGGLMEILLLKVGKLKIYLLR